MRADVQPVGIQRIVPKYQFRVEPGHDLTQMFLIDLDIDGAERRAIALNAEIQDQVFERIVGQHHDTVVGFYPARGQRAGDLIARVIKPFPGDRAVLIDGLQADLVGYALGMGAQARQHAAVFGRPGLRFVRHFSTSRPHDSRGACSPRRSLTYDRPTFPAT